MERKQMTIRLTLRPPDGLDEIIRSKAKEMGLTVNQLILSVLCQWAKSRRFPVRIP